MTDLVTMRTALGQTWPPDEILQRGDLTLRRSNGGGKRVTSASVLGGSHDAAMIDAAEAVMQDWSQPALFSLAADQHALDTALEARGYEVADPTRIFAAPIDTVARITPPRLSTFEIWPPMAIMADIWAEGGIGPDRIAVMKRVKGARTGLLGRQDDKPAATGFAAITGSVAMVHAVEVRKFARRKGLARFIMAHAARWAQDQGARTLAVAVTEANQAALALYAGLGLSDIGGYHYRIRKQ